MCAITQLVMASFGDWFDIKNITTLLIASIIFGIISWLAIRFIAGREEAFKQRHSILSELIRLLGRVKRQGEGYAQTVTGLSESPPKSEHIGIPDLDKEKMSIENLLEMSPYISKSEKSDWGSIHTNISNIVSQLQSDIESFNKCWDNPNRGILPPDVNWEKQLSFIGAQATRLVEIANEATKQIEKNLQCERWWKFWQWFRF